MQTSNEIIKKAIHVAANSFGHVIGEHEELVDELLRSGFTKEANRVDAIFDKLCGRNHKEIRANYIKLLNKISK